MIHITDVPQGGQVCEECVRLGDRWVHLRMCLTCGHIGCCDSSKNKHATKHYRTSDHPIVQSVEPGEDWRWCFVDEVLVPKKRQ
ncbi:MAG: UBP-type zinc finger domain-containing protein [Chloroflexaceae bacterium]|nr:UBP-type zinc finger domain-containing protein [Chloroflexaceae bacterium]